MGGGRVLEGVWQEKFDTPSDGVYDIRQNDIRQNVKKLKIKR